jgi:hypothetical protein
MNKRIEELAKLAETKEIGYYFFDREKFAELIVKECVQICETVSNDQVSNVSKDYLEGRKMGVFVCCGRIERHFGVEE